MKIGNFSIYGARRDDQGPRPGDTKVANPPRPWQDARTADASEAVRGPWDDDGDRSRDRGFQRQEEVSEEMTLSERRDRARLSSVERFIGGSPLGVAVRLLILSFVVGLILSVLDVNPAQIVDWVRLRFDEILNLGFDVFEKAGKYLVLGAVVVIPIWLISRILKAVSRR